MATHHRAFTLALAMVLLALPSLTYEVTLHVRPTSTNTSCSTHPCHILSEYAQNHQQYFNHSNITLQFLPGSHTLSVNLTIANLHSVEILGDSSAIIPTRVTCSFSVGFTFRDISNVRISVLAFVSCARPFVAWMVGDHHFTTYFGLYLQSVQTTEIVGCTFQMAAF